MSSKFKCVIIGFFLSCSFIPASAQSFLAPSAEWIERINVSFNRPTPWSILRFYLGDSVAYAGMQNQYVLNSRTGQYDTLGYVRESGKKVYMTLYNTFDFLQDQPQLSKEFLLYDFSLQQGDTISLRFYNETDTPHVMMLDFHVILKDSVNTLGGKRKQLTLVRTYADSGWTVGQNNHVYGVCLGDTLKWIEGVGCTITPFYSFEATVCAPAGWMGPWVSRNLLCHSKNGQIIYQPLGSCQLDVGLEEYSPAVEVFPNPTKGKLIIKGYPNLKKVSVYDLRGNLRRELKPTDEINIGGLETGLYILVLENEKGLFIQKKIIVE